MLKRTSIESTKAKTGKKVSFESGPPGLEDLDPAGGVTDALPKTLGAAEGEIQGVIGQVEGVEGEAAGQAAGVAGAAGQAGAGVTEQVEGVKDQVDEEVKRKSKWYRGCNPIKGCTPCVQEEWAKIKAYRSPSHVKSRLFGAHIKKKQQQQEGRL
ncbi:hypothetical protein TWF696_000420 [Orbilia brochopaga]|uniref:Uncharacterized protein n=1 Tax=Orbilia brochopaga TaxID=3140254 RepID=A0AAV9VET3_9PEZI